jgi:hypothetical protein
MPHNHDMIKHRHFGPFHLTTVRHASGKLDHVEAFVGTRKGAALWMRDIGLSDVVVASRRERFPYEDRT